MSIFDNDLRRLATALDRQHTAHTTSVTVTVASEAARSNASLNDTVQTHLANHSNPHSVTAAQTGAQPHHADLDSIVGLGANGLLRKTTGAYSLDVTSYQPWSSGLSAISSESSANPGLNGFLTRIGRDEWQIDDTSYEPTLGLPPHVGQRSWLTTTNSGGRSWATLLATDIEEALGYVPSDIISWLGADPFGDETAEGVQVSSAQLVWPNKVVDMTTPYLHLRCSSGIGTWTAWSKIYAGYADTAPASGITGTGTLPDAVLGGNVMLYTAARAAAPLFATNKGGTSQTGIAGGGWRFVTWDTPSYAPTTAGTYLVQVALNWLSTPASTNFYIGIFINGTLLEMVASFSSPVVGQPLAATYTGLISLNGSQEMKIYGYSRDTCKNGK